ncbi:MAG: methyltransferase [Thermoplasmata archaeon]
MRLPCLKISKQDAKDEIARLRRNNFIVPGYRIRREGSEVLIPVRESPVMEDFEEVRERRMRHVGGFDRISDFFVIREREGWEDVLSEIREKQNPRAVFLDTGVQGPFRIRKLKLVHGSGPPAGIHRENGLRYFVDLDKVYFSPRLASIRKLIVESVLSSGDVDQVVDMYAGVGPISIPISKGGRRTVAIDMNPEAVSILAKNAMINGTTLHIILADSTALAECLRHARHVIMNNPTQPLEVTERILGNFSRGTTVHLTILGKNEEQLKLKGWEMEEKRTVHGYSPRSSLFYYRLVKGND